jgi:hypothetical protein
MIKKLSSFFCKHILGRVTTTYHLSPMTYYLLYSYDLSPTTFF